MGLSGSVQFTVSNGAGSGIGQSNATSAVESVETHAAATLTQHDNCESHASSGRRWQWQARQQTQRQTAFGSELECCRSECKSLASNLAERLAIRCRGAHCHSLLPSLSHASAVVSTSDCMPYVSAADMDTSLVTPGEEVGSTEQYEAGDGVYVLDGRICACIVGARTFDKLDGHSATNGQTTGKVDSRTAPPERAGLCVLQLRLCIALTTIAMQCDVCQQPRLSVVGLKPLSIVPQPGDSVMARVSQQTHSQYFS